MDFWSDKESLDQFALDGDRQCIARTHGTWEQIGPESRVEGSLLHTGIQAQRLAGQDL